MAKKKTFHTFLEVLNAIYKDTREKEAKLYKTWQIAQDEYNATMADRNATEIVRTIAKGEYFQAREDYQNGLQKLREEHTEQVKQTRQAMEKFAADLYRATPDKLDQSAMQLLNTGIMGVDDLEHMAQQHRNNPTMLQIIGNHARKLGEEYSSQGRVEAARKANMLYVGCGGPNVRDHSKALEGFDALAKTASTLLQINGRRADYSQKPREDVSDGHWERIYGAVRTAYDNFLVQPGAESEE